MLSACAPGCESCIVNGAGQCDKCMPNYVLEDTGNTCLRMFSVRLFNDYSCYVIAIFIFLAYPHEQYGYEFHIIQAKLG